MEALASYDRTLVPGILGGAAGTTFDAFFQLAEAKKYGARAALYGRMINSSEHQTTFIQHLRWIADGDILDPAEGVRSYHGALEKVGVRAYRPLEEDVQSTLRDAAYGGTGGKKKTAVNVKPSGSPGSSGSSASLATTSGNGEPDFSKMSAAEKVKWNLDRWNRVLN
jgi:hypothetical protein